MRITLRFARALVATAGALALLIGVATPCGAQTFPARGVKLVVAYPPGGATDIIARTLAQALGTKWSQAVIVENKPGASGMLGAEHVVRSPPDGYTLLLGYTPEVALNKIVLKEMRYDPQSQLMPIALVADAPLILAAGPKARVNSFAALIEKKTERGELSFGSPGAGGQQHLAGELLRVVTGLNLLHVPYKGTAPAITDLLGGQIDLFFGTAPPLINHFRSGRLQPLMVTATQREPLLPEVPSARELGFEDFQVSNWFGVFAPAGLDRQVAEKLASDIQSVLADSTVVKSLEDQGLHLRYLGPKQFQAFIAAEMAKYGKIVEKTGIEKQ